MEISPDDSLALVPCSRVRRCSVDSNDAFELKHKNDNEFAKDQPDADTIKMFVGQVPKSWDEIKLRALFDKYGRVHTLNVLRDKVTMMSRGKILFDFFNLILLNILFYLKFFKHKKHNERYNIFIFKVIFIRDS